MLNLIIKNIILHLGPLYFIRFISNLIKGPSIAIIYGHRVLPDHIIADPDDPRTISGHTSVSDVKAAIKCLSKQYNFISIDEATQQIESNNIQKNCIVLTFDDGFEDNYLYLLPVLKEHNIPAVFYINQSVIGTDKSLWFQAIINYFFSIKENQITLEINQTNYDLSTPKKRFRAAFNFMRYLQSNHPPEVFKSIIDNIAGDSALPDLTDKHMSWKDLDQLCNEELITIGAHTVDHYPLTLCNNELASSQICDSVLLLEKRLPIKIKHFSYPRGHHDDFNEFHVKELKKIGIHSAVSTIRGTNTANENLYYLKRIGFPQKVIGNTTELLWYVAGLPQILSTIKNTFRINKT